LLTTGTKLTKVARPNRLLSDGTSGLPPVASRDWFAAIPATVRAAARRLLAESSHRGREGVIAFAVRTAGAARVLSHEPDRQHGTAAHYAYGDVPVAQDQVREGGLARPGAERLCISK